MGFGMMVSVCGVGVGMYLALATGHGHVHETAGVLHTLVGAALGGLLLLLGLDLFSSTVRMASSSGVRPAIDTVVGGAGVQEDLP